MKKYNLTKSHICISNLNSIKNVAETFVVFFRNVSRIIFLFFEIVSKTIFDENLSSSFSTSELSDSGKLPFLSFSKNVKCNLLLQSPETSSLFFSITFCSGREVKGLIVNDSKRSSKSSKCRSMTTTTTTTTSASTVEKVTLSSFFSGFYFPE